MLAFRGKPLAMADAEVCWEMERGNFVLSYQDMTNDADRRFFRMLEASVESSRPSCIRWSASRPKFRRLGGTMSDSSSNPVSSAPCPVLFEAWLAAVSVTEMLIPL